MTIIFTDAAADELPNVTPTAAQVTFYDATVGTILLASVNRILEGIGEMPITSLDTNGDTLAGDAQRMLEESTREMLAEGWAVNTIPRKTYTAGVDGRIALPGVISFSGPPCYPGRYVLRAGFLWDRDEQTDQISTLELYSVVVDVAFADLPEPVRRFCTSKAAVRFANTKQGDPNQLAYLRQVMQEDRAAALRFDGDQCQVNILDGYDALRVKGTIFPSR